LATAVKLIRELDSLVDPVKLDQMQDFQLGWFWKIFNKMRLAPHFRLPYDANFWALAGARTKGYWENHCALVVSCYKVQAIAGQTWIWHEGLVRLAEAGSQSSGSASGRCAEPVSTDTAQVALDSEPLKKHSPPIYELFLKAYKNYPKHIEKKESERKFLLAVKKHSKEQKIPEIDSAEFIAHKCAEYAAATERAGIERQFIPNMAKWLHRGRFLDDPSEWVVSYNVSSKAKPSKLRESFDVIDQMEF